MAFSKTVPFQLRGVNKRVTTENNFQYIFFSNKRRQHCVCFISFQPKYLGLQRYMGGILENLRANRGSEKSVLKNGLLFLTKYLLVLWTWPKLHWDIYLETITYLFSSHLSNEFGICAISFHIWPFLAF